MGNADRPIPTINVDDAQLAPQPELAAATLHHEQLPRQRTHDKRSLCKAYLFAIPPIGLFGGHHFYLGRPKFGLLYFFTIGLFGVGWLLDLWRMQCLVKASNQRSQRLVREQHHTKEKNVLDAYILWMPLGLFGFHHYYLGRWPWAIAYTFTFGLAGTGWIFDGFRMKCLVDEANSRRRSRVHQTEVDPEQLPGGLEHLSLVDSYVLCLSLFGILGAHQYYLGRYFIGMVYTFSGGCFGLGWLTDWMTLKIQFQRAQHIKKNGDDGLCYLDDAYRFLWPLGFLGLHYFYLRRPGYGVLYMFTFGLFAFGWIADFFRLPSLVKEANRSILEQREHLAEIQNRLGPNARVVGNHNYYVAYPTRDPYTGGMVFTTTSPGVTTEPNTAGNVAQASAAVSSVRTNDTAPIAPSEPPPSYHAVMSETRIRPAAAITTISEEDEEQADNVANLQRMSSGNYNAGFDSTPDSSGTKKGNM